eukprot:Rmarinus@m.16223
MCSLLFFLFVFFYFGCITQGGSEVLQPNNHLLSQLDSYYNDLMRSEEFANDNVDTAVSRETLALYLGNSLLDALNVRYPLCKETGNLAVSPAAAIRTTYRAQALHDVAMGQDGVVKEAVWFLGDEADVSWNPIEGLTASIDFARDHNPAKDLDIFFTGEFGYELLFVIPFAYYHHVVHKSLRSTVGCGHMAPFYFFSPNHTDIPDCRRSEWRNVQIQDFGIPSRKPNAYRPLSFWINPPYETHFGATSFVADDVVDRPLACVLNKMTLDNHFNLTNTFQPDTLARIIDALLPHYRVAYLRPRAETDIAHDNMTVAIQGSDFAMIRERYLRDVVQ